MTKWTLTQKQKPPENKVETCAENIDASPIDAKNFGDKSLAEIKKISLGRQTIGDWFDVQDSDGPDTVELRGDLRRFDHIGAALSSGELKVVGDAGNFLGGAADGKRLGMSGGRIVITGNVGDYAGHRMRRGEIWICGNVGRFAAAHMVAGTIVIAGKIGHDFAIGMRRGSLIVSQMPILADGRFSDPVESDFLIASLIAPPETGHLVEFWSRLQDQQVSTRRGDRAVGGQGEIVTPH
ncbi:GltB/FmdC/FwdC-like GXGXG domain-containing protein [Rubripirellula reticaptiva]|uniref:Formyltransferase/hydrolase complex Fhc subunit C n=1 Tax=Rubripirellula reticaptiva TaxID=2528013 RepID=A0A5C6EQA1_9BACT|nr:hypothetical protein [Rubripirellula reticaptiva]TWU49741.1 Formyltransferase/hydrolase complex Fhc subunit C [Rubripirellula reticaptiva]